MSFFGCVMDDGVLFMQGDVSWLPMSVCLLSLLQQVLTIPAPTAAAAAPAAAAAEALAPRPSAVTAAGRSARARWCVSKTSISTSSASRVKVRWLPVTSGGERGGLCSKVDSPVWV